MHSASGVQLFSETKETFAVYCIKHFVLQFSIQKEYNSLKLCYNARLSSHIVIDTLYHFNEVSNEPT